MNKGNPFQAVFAFGTTLFRKKPTHNVKQPDPQIDTPSSTPNTEDEVFKLATILFEHIEGQIKFADTKAQLTLAADAFLASAIGSSLVGTTVSSVKEVAKNLFDHAAPLLNAQRLVALFTVLLFLALAVSFGCALLAVMPRTMTKLRASINQQSPDTKYLDQLSFAQIGDLNQDTKTWKSFISKFDDQSIKGLRKSILTEVYIKSTNAKFKYKWVRGSILSLFAVLTFWIIVQLLVAFS